MRTRQESESDDLNRLVYKTLYLLVIYVYINVYNMGFYKDSALYLVKRLT